MGNALTIESRKAARRLLSSKPVDVLVIGGGITGAGCALDAASRGLTVGVVDSGDWAGGTSSRSSKLLHGGLRYLEMLDFALVHEAILERNLLLTKIAPHLAVPVPFVLPLTGGLPQRAYLEAGVSLYDSMAVFGGVPAVPVHRFVGRGGLADLFPALDREEFSGAIRYYDARVDDARLVIDVLRTAAQFGAQAMSRTTVVGMLTDDFGRVNGARLRDEEDGTEFEVQAGHVINATGVWTERTESLSGASGGLRVLASKGVHIIVPRRRINGRTGIISRTERSVLFVIPWKDVWIIGTTDTPWHGDLRRPRATSEDVRYLLGQANKLLTDPIGVDDVIGAYAGLRPLLQEGVKEGTASTKVSREHTVASPVPGLTVIAGGKLTTYRIMARDAVDFALGHDRAQWGGSRTAQTPLVGARGLQGIVARRDEIARVHSWSKRRVTRLINRYGTSLYDLLQLIDDEPDLAEPVEGANGYLRAEIVYAVTHEGAMHLDDVMVRRTRIEMEQPQRGAAALEDVARLLAGQLGWDDETRAAELAAYRGETAAWHAAVTNAAEPHDDGPVDN